MNIAYKLFRKPSSAHFKDPNKLQPRNTNSNELIIETIKNLFLSEEQEDYKLMEESILKLSEVFEELPQGLYNVISPFPIIDSLICATYIPQIKRENSLLCIVNLLDVQPEVYQNQLLNSQNFINDLFREISDNESDDVYYCIYIIYKLVEGFQSNKEYLISNLNVFSLGNFSMEDINNAILCLNLMKEIVKLIKTEVPIEVKDDILKMFIQISNDIFIEYKSLNPSIVNEVLDFCNEMISNHFLVALPIKPLIDKIFNEIDPSDTPLIFTALCYYITVISNGINQKYTEDQPRFLDITKQIISEANIREIVEWIKQIESPYSCHVGYKFLSDLIINQDILEIDVIDIINESSILGSAYKNILDCQFKQKLSFLNFFITFINEADSQIITDDNSSNMFFNLFDYLLQQPFEIKGIIEVVDLFSVYLTKFQSQRPDDDLLSVLETFDFYDELNDIKSADEYNDDALIGKIDTILRIFQNLK